MRATLHITSGAYAGRKIVLRDGQAAQFGRTEWADFSFPADQAMSDVHFRIDCSGRQCRLQDLQSASGTWVDGQEVTELVLRTGTVVTAGQTSFMVVLGDDAPPTLVRASDASRAPTEPPMDAASPSIDVAELAREAQVSKPALKLAKGAKSLEAYLQSLREAQLAADAFTVALTHVGARPAIAWGCDQVAQVSEQSSLTLDEQEQAALATARRWAAEPDEALAQEAHQLATDLELETPAAWLAEAAYFGAGNLGTAEYPVPAPPGLFAAAVRASCDLLAARLPPDRAQGVRAQLLDSAIQLALNARKD